MGTQIYANGAAHELPASMVGDVTELPSVNPSESSPEPTREIKRLRDLKSGIRDMPMMDPRIILIDDGHNVRDYTKPENHAHLDELKRSIRENGTLVPLLVRFDAQRKAAVLVDGECRLRANLELIAEGVEILSVPTIQVSGGSESDRLLTSITANTGKPFSKWELGTAFQRLYKFGWDEDRIATKTGYAPAYVKQAMELADAPDEVKELLSSGAVSPSLALAEVRANGAAAVENLKAAASAVQASGKKGPAKRGKAPAKAQTVAPAAVPAPARPAPASIPIGVVTAILSLCEDVPVEDLNAADCVDVVVKRSKLLKLATFALTAEEKAALGITV